MKRSNTYAEIEALGRTYPWSILERATDHRRLILFRWARDEHGQYRHEVCVIFDRAGRVSAVSEWKNYQHRLPDQMPGRRGRLLDVLRDAIKNPRK